MIEAFISAFTRLIIGAYPYWRGSLPSQTQRIYFANHTSHLDTMAIWSSLKAEYRRRARPVAAKDYWGKGGVRGIIARQGLNVVLVDRGGQSDDPLTPLYAALEAGDSLIIFPEGTRRDDAQPSQFKSGLYHLSRRYPEIEYIPVYLDNTRRSLPKGVFLPLPFTCKVTFGAPLPFIEGETKESYLNRAREAVIQLSQAESNLSNIETLPSQETEIGSCETKKGELSSENTSTQDTYVDIVENTQTKAAQPDIKE